MGVGVGGHVFRSSRSVLRSLEVVLQQLRGDFLVSIIVK